MPRLFFAVDTPSAIRDVLGSAQDVLVKRLQELRPEPNFKRENLANSHCTIRFLGNVDEKLVAALIENVGLEFERTRQAAFEERVSKSGVFLQRGKARIIWAGLEPIASFQKLQQIVDKGVTAAGVSIDDERELHPHLTLIRFREPYRLPSDFEFPSFPEISVLVPEVLLVLSKTLPQGATHEVIARFPLSS